uniref:Uncharacterized protein n=1 Tax=Kalanchoe fedtschenkoi TaxID=63787 RepID=A0A7N0TBD5_KALFE
MSTCKCLLPLLSTLSILLFVASATADTKAVTAHDELNKLGFPNGLLPPIVTSYHLNRTSGDFSVLLGESCKVTLPPDNYLATYSKKITGKIAEKRIAELNGISVWAFFKWWSITGIRASGDNLVFEVGGISAKYPSKNFDESPQCQGSKASS